MPAARERRDDARPELLTPEETLGQGDELLYVYFNEAERKLASHEGRDWWPCKIGFTTGLLSGRILQQDRNKHDPASFRRFGH